MTNLVDSVEDCVLLAFLAAVCSQCH